MNPFSSPALEGFRAHVGRLVRSDLGLDADTSRGFVESATTHFAAAGEISFPAVETYLHANGIRDRWNAVLRSARSAALADWIAPHVKGTLLDLLCGFGGVGAALEARGLDVTLAESEVAPPAKFGTVLICTNLHHEETPEHLLALGASLAEHRLIVVENCIEQEYPLEYQLLMDLFFNQCLNQSSLASPGSHRPASAWVAAAAPFGELVHVEHKRGIPGIPLGHHLIVMEMFV